MIYEELIEVLETRGHHVDALCEAQGTEDDLCQDTTYYVQLWTDATKEQIRNALDELDPPGGCGHQYDCCGCWFLKSFNFCSMYDREGVAYIVCEKWARNY